MVVEAVLLHPCMYLLSFWLEGSGVAPIVYLDHKNVWMQNSITAVAWLCEVAHGNKRPSSCRQNHDKSTMLMPLLPGAV
jgi:hypothetical protein